MSHTAPNFCSAAHWGLFMEHAVLFYTILEDQLCWKFFKSTCNFILGGNGGIFQITLVVRKKNKSDVCLSNDIIEMEEEKSSHCLLGGGRDK